MWIIFGVGAIIALGLNLKFYMTNRNADIFRFISLSLTALTVCSFYAQNKTWVIKEDWSALLDVVPAMSTALWILVAISILTNGISLIKSK
ncbi:hypothetical protein [Chakrabartyella piscis]|uniref:hypothetical protein n=1 Tax=Chakrabartyella piscis TaxID=2918914 RepID=UPI002958DCE0|nr:hypothetical protein [Chakrabartyella piscis]